MAKAYGCFCDVSIGEFGENNHLQYDTEQRIVFEYVEFLVCL